MFVVELSDVVSCELLPCVIYLLSSSPYLFTLCLM